MRNILLSAIENSIGDKNENRELDLVEPDSERDIHEEISAVLEERVSDRKPRKKTVRRNKGIRSQV